MRRGPGSNRRVFVERRGVRRRERAGVGVCGTLRSGDRIKEREHGSGAANAGIACEPRPSKQAFGGLALVFHALIAPGSRTRPSPLSTPPPQPPSPPSHPDEHRERARVQSLFQRAAVREPEPNRGRYSGDLGTRRSAGGGVGGGKRSVWTPLDGLALGTVLKPLFPGCRPPPRRAGRYHRYPGSPAAHGPRGVDSGLGNHLGRRQVSVDAVLCPLDLAWGRGGRCARCVAAAVCFFFLARDEQAGARLGMRGKGSLAKI